MPVLKCYHLGADGFSVVLETPSGSSQVTSEIQIWILRSMTHRWSFGGPSIGPCAESMKNFKALTEHPAKLRALLRAGSHVMGQTASSQSQIW